MKTKQLKRLALISAILPLLAACQTTGSGEIDPSLLKGVVDCSVLKPIRWSKADTRLTQEQIVVYNRVYKKVCMAKENK